MKTTYKEKAKRVVLDRSQKAIAFYNKLDVKILAYWRTAQINKQRLQNDIKPL